MINEPNPFADVSLVGGRLCLDFVNTVDEYTHRGEDRLRAYADLVWWGLHAGALDAAAAEPLFALAASEPARADAVHARAVDLREALFRVFAAARAGAAPDEAHLAVINRELLRAMAHQRMRAQNGGFAYAWEEGVDLERVLWPVVRDAAELLVSGELRRVGKCCGESCDWLYLDTSRNRSRRWCDMQACGNRAKARRHYHRSKGGHG